MLTIRKVAPQDRYQKQEGQIFLRSFRVKGTSQSKSQLKTDSSVHQINPNSNIDSLKQSRNNSPRGPLFDKAEALMIKFPSFANDRQLIDKDLNDSSVEKEDPSFRNYYRARSSREIQRNNHSIHIVYPTTRAPIVKYPSPERFMTEPPEISYCEKLGYNNYLPGLEQDLDPKRSEKIINAANVIPGIGNLISKLTKFTRKKPKIVRPEKPPLFENMEIAKSLGLPVKKVEKYNPLIATMKRSPSQNDNSNSPQKNFYFNKKFPSYPVILEKMTKSLNKNRIEDEFEYYANLTFNYHYLAPKSQIAKGRTTPEEKKMVTRIFVQSQDSLKNMPKQLLNRVLKSFEIDPDDQLFPIDFTTFSKFKKILINKDSHPREMLNFLIKVK